jgi:hypothetical protein
LSCGTGLPEFWSAKKKAPIRGFNFKFSRE